jgi:glycosyltransferase involved in cell wall biosynthesis
MRVYWSYPTFAPFASYAKLSNELRRTLTRRGVEFIPLGPYETKRTPGWALAAKYPDIGGACPTVIAGTAGYMKDNPIGKIWGLTMFESTGLPKDWVDTFDKFCERVILPCQWCYDSFRAAGFAGNLHVVPLGVNVGEFQYVERPKRDTYTFLTIGDHGRRKGWDITMQALGIAFGPLEDLYGKYIDMAHRLMTDLAIPEREYYCADVRLIVKMASTAYGVLRDANCLTDRRVRLWIENVDSMADVYALADAFVFPTRAEGYGLPPREAAATGLPVICTDYSGMAGEVRRWGIPLAYEEVDVEPWARQPNDYYSGRWAHPDVYDLALRMRQLYENRTYGNSLGREASEWIHANCTWEHSADVLMELFEKYG